MREALKALRDAAAAGCSYHHLPLVNGWCHRVQFAVGLKTCVCPLSREVREAIIVADRALAESA